MSDEALKDAIIAAVLKQAPAEGFSPATLHKAAIEVGADHDLPRLFPNGVVSLLEDWSHRVDAGMVARLAGMNIPALSVRKRIRAAVLTRLEILKPDKEAARRAAAWFALPPNAPFGARLVYDTVDAMWRAAGDVSTDFNFYTKRGILAGVYSGTLLRWFNDTSGDESGTQAFLDARIENVMQYEKLKGRVREQCKTGLACLSDLLRSARGI